MKPWLDATRIGDLAQCSTRALMRHHFGFCAERSLPLSFGSAWHKAMEWWGAEKPIEEAKDAFRAAWKEEKAEGDQYGRDLENGLRLLEAWYLQHPAKDLFIEINECELALELELETVTLVGRMDAIGRSKLDGSIWGIEYKTTGRMDSTWIRQWSYSHQITGYTALVEAYTKKPCQGILVMGVETKVVPNSNRKCAAHGVQYEECGLRHALTQVIPTTRTPAAVQHWLYVDIPRWSFRWADLIAKYPEKEFLQDAPTEGQANRACNWCEFRLYCESGKPSRMLDSFVVNHWDPRNTEETA